MTSGGSLVFFLITVVATLTFASVALMVFIAGKRYRHPDGVPHCRKCDFNLRASATAADRCPECGANITGGRNIVRGTRMPSRRVMTGAGATLAVTLLVGGTLATHFFRQVDWQTSQPTWWLMRQTHSNYVGTRSGAFTILVPRAANDEMSEERKDELAKALVDHYVTSSAMWDPAWGSFLVERLADGRLPDDLRDRFFRAFYKPTRLKLRSHVRKGDVLPLSATAGVGIGWDSTRLASTESEKSISIFIGGHLVREGAKSTRSEEPFDYMMSLMGYSGSSTKVTREELANLEPGEHEVELRGTVHVLNGFEPDKSLVAVPYSAKATFTLLPPDQETVKLVQPEELKPLIARAFEFDLVHVDGVDAVQVNVKLTQPLPVDMAFQLYIVDGNREWEVTEILYTANKRSTWMLNSRAAGVKPGTYDVVLRPSKPLAAATLDMTEIWGGEVVIKDVVIRDGK